MSVAFVAPPVVAADSSCYFVVAEVVAAAVVELAADWRSFLHSSMFEIAAFVDSAQLVPRPMIAAFQRPTPPKRTTFSRPLFAAVVRCSCSVLAPIESSRLNCLLSRIRLGLARLASRILAAGQCILTAVLSIHSTASFQFLLLVTQFVTK